MIYFVYFSSFRGFSLNTGLEAIIVSKNLRKNNFFIFIFFLSLNGVFSIQILTFFFNFVPLFQIGFIILGYFNFFFLVFQFNLIHRRTLKLFSSISFINFTLSIKPWTSYFWSLLAIQAGPLSNYQGRKMFAISPRSYYFSSSLSREVELHVDWVNKTNTLRKFFFFNHYQIIQTNQFHIYRMVIMFYSKIYTILVFNLLHTILDSTFYLSFLFIPLIFYYFSVTVRNLLLLSINKFRLVEGLATLVVRPNWFYKNLSLYQITFFFSYTFYSYAGWYKANLKDLFEQFLLELKFKGLFLQSSQLVDLWIFYLRQIRSYGFFYIWYLFLGDYRKKRRIVSFNENVFFSQRTFSLVFGLLCLIYIFPIVRLVLM